MTSTIFRRLEISNWRQFKSVELDFSPNVTILTGQNGTGKSTILNMLAQHSGFGLSLLGAPTQKRDEKGRFTSGSWYEFSDPQADEDVIGRLTYSDHTHADLSVPRYVDRGFRVNIRPKRAVSALNISSHRRVPTYAAVGSIPTKPISSASALQSYQSEFWSHSSRIHPLVKMKEAIISMAAFGPGNDRVRADPEAIKVLVDFEQRLMEIIPKSIGFRRLSVAIPDVIMETDSGEFFIDASSGGLMSIIDLTWELTLFALQNPHFSVLFDEPENHLHPSMQRELLPSLVRAFPEAQFIVATHSPFVVSSVRDASIFAFDVESGSDSYGSPILDYSSAHNAVVSVPIYLNTAVEAHEVLNQVLGLSSTAPMWVEEMMNELLQPLRDGDVTKEDLTQLRQSLSERGLSRYFPEFVAKAVGPNENNS